MAYLVIPSVFENYWENVVNEFCTAMMDVLLYGVFIVLFFLAMYLLYHRKTPRPQYSPRIDNRDGTDDDDAIFSSHCDDVARNAPPSYVDHEWAAFRSSPSCGAREALLVAGAGGGHRTRHKYVGLSRSRQDYQLIEISVITDGLLVRAIYRCYLVWGRPSKIFIVVPVLLMLGTLATGYVTSYDEDYSSGPYHFDPRIVFTLNLFTNFVLMLLTAGRIWWITRAQHDVFGTELTPRYNAVIAIILESGAIYCCGLVFQVIALSIQDSFPTRVYFSHGTAGQLVNIVPTLIVVRVGMGHAVAPVSGDSTGASVPRSRVHTSRPLRFASAAFSRSDGECGDSEVDIGLEGMSRK
ncbi:hypothetical protein MSAN_02000700 [Mycena sanguinolenta]|uniref:Uncharacterized protein n=1 Tax=Mycena sanguinolenta TaxID=230812 RepID=A0A8H6XLX8_9AGAR|nr:hypothetical protein MSAN_02000700 [Mycena sanguinolenta]